MHLALSRHLRSLARRQAPAHGPVEATSRLLRGGLPRRGRRPLPVAVSVLDLFGARGRSPRGPEPALEPGARAEPLLPLQRARGRAGLRGPRDARLEAGGAAWASIGTSPSSAPATAWSSGTPPPGRTTTGISPRVVLTSPHPLAILLDMPHARPRPRRGAHRGAGPAAGPGRGRLHPRRRRPRPPGRRPARPVGHADRDRPRPARGGGVRRARRRGRLRHPLHPRRLRARPAPARRGGRPGRPRLPRPRDVLDAGRHARARLLLRLRRAAGHADGPRPGAHRPRGRQHLGAPPARARAARVRRGALRRPDRRLDRARAPARDHLRARRRDQGRDPRARPLRRRPPRQAHLPGDPDRRQRGARPARRRAAARVADPARGRPPGRHLLPLARGPARQALPRRPHPRLHLPARPPGLRLRPHPRGRARLPPLDRAQRGRDRGEPARTSARLRAARKLKEEH